MPELEIKNLSKQIKRKRIIDNINLNLKPGVYGLIGPNGAGKTTLIRCICKVYRPDSGSIEYHYDSDKTEKDFGKIIGYLPQEFGLFKDMKVKDMLAYISHLKGIKDNIQPQIDKVLELVNLTDVSNKKIKTLSGGMVRRLGIAQAILGNPLVIIFDEPTSGLDPEERVRFKNIIKGLSKDVIVIISTHIIADVEDVCDCCLVMNGGCIKFNGSIEDLKKRADDEEKYGSQNKLEEGVLCILKD